MSPRLIIAIVFIEGFCSLGAEVIALRRLVPHVGSSIVITAPTIGFFLLALALGYAAGGRVAGNYSAVVARNFMISAALAGIGLAGITVDWLFAHLQPTLVAYLFFVGGVLCPLAWLLGQTVPILTNLMQAERTGKAVGKALLIRDITEKKVLIEQLHQTASTDELTGVFNRRHLMELSHRAFQLAQRHQQPLSVIIVDVDHFKAINDRRGHLAGDVLLSKIAALFAARLRATDILGRYGGDEFIIALPETDAQRAGELARELNTACLAECGATLSLGVAQSQAAHADFNTLLGKADEALYRAKAGGRNQVAIAGQAGDRIDAASLYSSKSPVM